MLEQNENFKFKMFTDEERRNNYIFNSTMNDLATIYVTSTIASKHRHTFLMQLPKETDKNTIDRIINVLKGVNTIALSTTWTISKSKIQNSEQETIKQALTKNGINIDFSVKVIKTPKKIMDIIFKSLSISQKKNKNKNKKLNKNKNKNKKTSSKKLNKKSTSDFKYTQAKKKKDPIYEQLNLFDMFI